MLKSNYKKIIITISVFVVMFLSNVTYTFSAPNYEINYQGKLTNASNVAVADGTYNMRFWLLTSPSIATTSAVWTEELTTTNKVQVTDGLFSVMLGSTTPLTSVDFNQTLYLGVEIGGTGAASWDGEMSPRKILGAVPAAFQADEADNANTVGGVASTSLLRSDQDDTASGLLTFTGGFISNSSSTITNLTSLIATTTTLVINGESFTDLAGTGLTNSAGVLTTTLGTDISTGEIADGDHGFFSYSSGVASLDTGGLTSANLLGSLTDETGTGLSVFGTNPLLSGFRSNASSTIGDGTATGGLTVSGNSTTTGDAYFGGDVGIGTDSPNDLLHVVADSDFASSYSNTFERYQDTGAGVSFNLKKARGSVSSPTASLAGDRIVQINGFGYGDTDFSAAAVAHMRYYSESTFTDSSMPTAIAFATTPTTSVVAVERLRIDSDGNVGIGRTPTGPPTVGRYTLQVDKATVMSHTSNVQFMGNAYFDGTDRFASSGKYAQRILFNESNGQTRFDRSDAIGNQDDPITFLRTMTFDADGNVGIGTTSPNAKLDVVGTLGSQDALFNISSTTATDVLSPLLTVLANGNVGIGTDSPDYQLHAIREYTNTSGNPFQSYGFMDINPAATSTATFIGSRPSVEVRSGNTSDISIVLGLAPRVFHYGTGTIGDARGNNLVLNNQSSGVITSGTAGQFELRNSSNGSIGTAKAGYFLMGNTNAGGSITAAYGGYTDLTNSGTITDTYGFYVGDITSGTQTNTPFSFYASDASAYNYFAGNVGIGTTSPTSLLHVYNPSSASTLTLESEVASNATVRLVNSVSNWKVQASTAGTFRIKDEDGGTYPLVIEESTPTDTLYLDSPGNIGVGTTTPAAKLHVAGTVGGNFGAMFSNTANNAYVNNQFKNDAGLSGYVGLGGSSLATAYNGRIYLDSFGGNGVSLIGDSGDIRFYIDGTTDSEEVMRIDTDGNVGIGTSGLEGLRSGLGQKLDIAASANNGGMALSTWSATDSQSSLLDFVKSGSSTIGAHSLVADDENLGSIVFRGSDGVEFQNAASIIAAVDGTPGAGDMPGRLTFSTVPDGSTSVVERMRIDSEGNIGIRVTNPAFPLEVNSGSTASATAEFSGGAETTYGNASAQSGQINLGSNPIAIGKLAYGWNSGDFYIVNTWNSDNGDIIFRVKENGTPNNAMTIEGSGDVGIGTADPTSNLTVQGTAGQSANLFSVASSTGTQFLTVTSDGKIGIGTASPTAPLHIVGDDATIRQQATSSTGYMGSNYYDDDGALAFSFQYGNGSVGQTILQDAAFIGTRQAGSPLYFVTGGLNYRMSIDEDGKVGIGTTTPTQDLTVEGSGSTEIMIRSTSGTAYPGFKLEHADQTWNVQVNGSTDQLRFRDVTNGVNPVVIEAGAASNSLYIDSAGEVGIGDPTPTYKLDVAGTGRFTGNVDVDAGLDVTGNITVTGTVDGKDIATNAAMLDEAETISGNWVNTTNPWADNEVADDITVNGGTLGSSAVGTWSSADTDIDGLLPGSAAGTLLEGPTNFHLTMGIRGNGANDSFSIISGGGNYSTDSTYDTVVAYFEADGDVGIGDSTPTYKLDVAGTGRFTGNLDADAGLDVGGADLTITGHQLDFDESVDDKVHWYGTTYTTGVEASTLFWESAVNFRWYAGAADSGTSDIMQLTGSALDVEVNLDANAGLDVTGDVSITGNVTSGTWQGTAIADAYIPNSITIDSATNFSGSLVGDVTGTMGATVVGNDSHTHGASTISGLGPADISGLGVADFSSANISQWTNDSGYITSNLSENTVEGYIFDADAETITGNWKVQDDVDLTFGANSDWNIQYDEGVDNQLLFQTINTATIATTDPMVEFLVGTTPTANQQVFGVAKGTQAANTALLTLDEDGDAVITGDLTVSGFDVWARHFRGETDSYAMLNADTYIYLDVDEDNDGAGGIIMRDGANSSVFVISESGSITTGDWAGSAIADAYIPNTITINTATSFSGSLSGDVTGTQGATVVGNDSHTHNATTISGLGAADISGLGVADFSSANISQWTNNSGYYSSGSSGSFASLTTTSGGNVTVNDGSMCIGDTSCSTPTNDGYLSVRNGIVMDTDGTAPGVKYGFIIIGDGTDGAMGMEIEDGSLCVGNGGCTASATDGDISYVSLTAISDESKKNRITGLTGSLELVSALRPVSFWWNTQEEDGKQIGFIAQEVEQVIPELVKGEYGDKRIRMTSIISVNTGAIQELNLKLESLATTSSSTLLIQQDDFAGQFFSSLFDRLTAWLSDATNGIGDFFVNRVHTKEICVSDDSGETCITKSQLDSLLGATGASVPDEDPDTNDNDNGNTDGGSSGGGTDDTDTGTTTDNGTDTGTSDAGDTGTTTPDTTAPVITLEGDSDIELTTDDTYIEEGASAIDDIDGDISLEIAISGDTPANSVGVYEIDYDVVDSSGNAATTVTRTVTVAAAPEIPPEPDSDPEPEPEPPVSEDPPAT